ncbi:acetyl-/propionyl-coenzyme A carboxylase alpha chain [Mycolicibacterium hassiacum DSM 44199]|uniref:biotin carboxylase n=1 Tax=Mycolicibacterium hassiacum (strain DSM 44199 / CIP 105218 / JCM 12690 / 3849) TaxID=1122247 RepID=K5B825_MYCHD|nr:acetyl/propionyl/methylcrotonyl-CoA carboxylase subunit alpha [Mycolicibacterium hassiacum]EKF22958.1 acetyl-/propionyl-coenzyme A carboxylase alpha chain [Mycolicibacterium hassiacum DSM 44199]MBX5487411.1 acetyl/propionyl/methylcrotonyl-CoA carboxylase subunit alpha [Mycolicibacterium hassiacum]MDA4087269.1 biotin carboxyl carrier protein [Mycolicibacterium hassiacum DSM 44199]VCT89418.1 Acetyl-/propionyl-coenzyme A carboxylase alpha chain [Mycolicibacterium hassiacum DSM 44199]
MTAKAFDTVLIANRGEIAVRVIRTLRRMGIRSVAVFSDADANARHVAEADAAVHIGPAPARRSYLDIGAVVDAARRTGAQAVHPGYGFLAENAQFAAALAEAGIVFIGPSAAAIETMGDKIAARAAVSAFGVPVVPGVSEPGLTDEALIAGAADIGYPVLVKPSAGGGGKGMRVVHDPAELPAALAAARREAASAFGDDTLFIERFVTNPRHIEVQVLADGYGNVVHLGERECSLQRRHQKVIEEAPSPLLDAATRARIGAAACDTARSVSYTGAGTVEFIVSADRPDEFFFMEMNTRLQVEHPVTELVTGIDLVEQQVRIAAGEKLPVGQDDITLTGHAIEARVYAEDPGRGFLPTGGTVLGLAEPTGPGVRVDSGLALGTVVGSDYDPMLAKVIAHGADRAQALRTLDRALAETAVLGVGTNIEFLRYLLADADVVAGRLDTGLLDRRLPDFRPADPDDRTLIAAGAYLWLRAWPDPVGDLWAVPSGWRIGEPAPVSYRLRAGQRTDHVYLTGTPGSATARVEDGESHMLTAALTGDRLTVTLDGLRTDYLVAAADGQLWLAGPDGTAVIEEVREAPVRPDDEHSGDAELTSPMPGSVVAVGVTDGQRVRAGTVVVTVEAMKMEHALTTPVDGVVELLVAVGDQVKVGQPLARVTTATEEEQS